MIDAVVGQLKGSRGALDKHEFTLPLPQVGWIGDFQAAIQLTFDVNDPFHLLVL